MELRTAVCRIVCNCAALLVLCAFALAGCSTAQPNAGGGAAAGEEEKMIPGDIISVTIEGVPDPPKFEGSIDAEGNIEMLYLGKIKTAGFTPADFAERIKYIGVERSEERRVGKECRS